VRQKNETRREDLKKGNSCSRLIKVKWLWLKKGIQERRAVDEIEQQRLRNQVTAISVENARSCMATRMTRNLMKSGSNAMAVLDGFTIVAPKTLAF
jgi:hypothetical protein